MSRPSAALAIVAAAGGGKFPIKKTPAYIVDYRTAWPRGPQIDNGGPVWSPDGRRIAFVSGAPKEVPCHSGLS
jgi:hypothetical protein